MALFVDGAKRYKKAEFDAAAESFHAAFATDARPEYLFNAARSEHRAGHLTLARDHYEACLALDEVPRPIQDRAREHLAEIREGERQAAEQAAREQAAREAAQREAAAQAAAQATVAVQAVPADATRPTWQPIAGWSAIGTGLAAGAVAAWLVVDGATRQSDLDGRTSELDASGRIVGTDYESYRTEQDAIDAQRTVGFAAAGLAAAAVATGAWLLWRTPDAAAPNTAALALDPWRRTMLLRVAF